MPSLRGQQESLMLPHKYDCRGCRMQPAILNRSLALLKTNQPTTGSSSLSHQALAAFPGFYVVPRGAEKEAMDPKTFQDIDLVAGCIFGGITD